MDHGEVAEPGELLEMQLVKLWGFPCQLVKESLCLSLTFSHGLRWAGRAWFLDKGL